jgi:hypothetical protein
LKDEQRQQADFVSPEDKATLRIVGIKWPPAADTLEFPFCTHSTKANLSVDLGLLEMLQLNINDFKANPSIFLKLRLY